MNSLAELNQANRKFHDKNDTEDACDCGDAKPKNTPVSSTAKKVMALQKKMDFVKKQQGAQPISVKGYNDATKTTRGGQVVVQHDEGDSTPEQRKARKESTNAKVTGLGRGARSDLAEGLRESRKTVGSKETRRDYHEFKHEQNVSQGKPTGDSFPATDRTLADVQRANDEKFKPVNDSEPEHEVHVTNVGSVHKSNSFEHANKVFHEYRKISKAGQGRAGGETVTHFKRGSIVQQHEGHSD